MIAQRHHLGPFVCLHQAPVDQAAQRHRKGQGRCTAASTRNTSAMLIRTRYGLKKGSKPVSDLVLVDLGRSVVLMGDQVGVTGRAARRVAKFNRVCGLPLSIAQ